MLSQNVKYQHRVTMWPPLAKRNLQHFNKKKQRRGQEFQQIKNIKWSSISMLTGSNQYISTFYYCQNENNPSPSGIVLLVGCSHIWFALKKKFLYLDDFVSINGDRLMLSANSFRPNRCLLAISINIGSLKTGQPDGCELSMLNTETDMYRLDIGQRAIYLFVCYLLFPFSVVQFVVSPKLLSFKSNSSSNSWW